MSKTDDGRRDKQGKKKRRGEQGKEEEGKSLRGSRLPGFEGKKKEDNIKCPKNLCMSLYKFIYS